MFGVSVEEGVTTNADVQAANTSADTTIKARISQDFFIARLKKHNT